jgi:hypothetical protein
MNDLYLKIESMVKKIQDTGKAKIVSAEFRYFSESTVQYKNEKNLPFFIPTSILEFYKDIDFAEIAWYIPEGMLKHYLDEELDIVGGYVKILSFKKLLQSFKNNNRGALLDPTHSFPEEKQSLLNEFVPFDCLEGNGAVCFRLHNNQPEDNLYLVKSGLECIIEPLEINCRDYFLKGCKHYFFNDWQQALFLNHISKKKVMNFYLDELELKII